MMTMCTRRIVRTRWLRRLRRSIAAAERRCSASLNLLRVRRSGVHRSTVRPVALITRVLKRVIIGTPMSSEAAGHMLLKKRLALPIFASDALSSVAYATQEILLVLTIGGTAFLYLAPWVAGAVVGLMAPGVASYPPPLPGHPPRGGRLQG